MVSFKEFQKMGYKMSYAEFCKCDCSTCKKAKCLHRNAYRRIPSCDGGLGLCPQLSQENISDEIVEYSKADIVEMSEDYDKMSNLLDKLNQLEGYFYIKYGRLQPCAYAADYDSNKGMMKNIPDNVEQIAAFYIAHLEEEKVCKFIPDSFKTFVKLGKVTNVTVHGLEYNLYGDGETDAEYSLKYLNKRVIFTKEKDASDWLESKIKP